MSSFNIQQLCTHCLLSNIHFSCSHHKQLNGDLKRINLTCLLLYVHEQFAMSLHLFVLHYIYIYIIYIHLYILYIYYIYYIYYIHYIYIYYIYIYIIYIYSRFQFRWQKIVVSDKNFRLCEWCSASFAKVATALDSVAEKSTLINL